MKWQQRYALEHSSLILITAGNRSEADEQQLAVNISYKTTKLLHCYTGASLDTSCRKNKLASHSITVIFTLYILNYLYCEYGTEYFA